jgi:hypothetical protein
MIPLGESRGGTPTSVRAPKGRAPHRKMRRLVPCVCRRSASFNLFRSPGERSKTRGAAVKPHSRSGCRFAHPGYETRYGRTKSRPHPCPFLGPDRFRARCEHIFSSARSRAEKLARHSASKTRVNALMTRRENENACHESPQKLAQETPPSPQRGEGWGEGVRASEQKLGLPNPLILSFSPISAFTRVFDALWGRRDAACWPRSDPDSKILPAAAHQSHMHRTQDRPLHDPSAGCIIGQIP